VKIHVFFFILLFCFNFKALSHTQVFSASEINKPLLDSYAFLFASNYTKDPLPLGTDFNVELQGGYLKNFSQNELSSKNIYFNTLSAHKGIYYNLSLDLSFLGPINKSFQSGYAAGVSHTYVFSKFTLKSRVYFSSYNIDEILNYRNFGANSLIYYKIDSIYFGLGLVGERVDTDIQTTDEISSKEFKFFSYRGTGSVLYIINQSRVSLDFTLKNTDAFNLSIGYGFRI
jgi:hypothetical protein